VTIAAQTAAPVARASDARSVLATALAAARPAGLMVISVPAPVAPLETLLDALPGDGLLWDPPVGPAFAGSGVAWEAAGSGPERVAELRARLGELWPALAEVSSGEVPRVRVFGGLAFAPGAAREPEWRGFGDALLVLPRWRYARTHAGAWLSFAVPGRAALPGLGRALAELDQIWAALADPPAPPPATVVTGVTQLSPTDWAFAIAEIHHELLAGRAEKIVAARRAEVALAGLAAATAALARLAGGSGTTRFAFTRGGVSFLGATPERLIARHGREVSTEALAGSASGGARALLASAKDRGEHGLVVREIVRTLRPLCETLELPERPTVRELRHVIHLHTPISGRLAAPVHVLDLVAALHPTPAVGGVPAAAALDWIAAHEAPRGWYAGPIGWVDATGDGEFAVALRSGLLVGRRAWVYAGAGIVAGSDPAAEYAETELKQRAVMGALGA
jgi:isochorismate synthase